MLKSRKWLKGLSLILSFIIMISAIAAVAAMGTDSVSEQIKTDVQPKKTTSLLQLNAVKRDRQGSPVKRSLDGNDVLVSENKNLALYLNKDNLIVKVLDKANNYVWSSGIDTAEVAELSKDWQNFSRSILVAEYMDKYAPNTLIREYPISKGVRMKDNGFAATVFFTKPEIQVDIMVTLSDDGITVDIPDETIKFMQDPSKVKFELAKLYIMPFLGAVEGGEADGYLFVPDGSGALIRFGTAKKYSIGYTSRVYGKDYGIKRDIDLTENTVPTVKGESIHIPVFGISHGYQDNAFACIIENGGEYADIEAFPAGATIDYFWAAAKFNYMEAYFQQTGTGLGFDQLPKVPNKVNAKVSYKFLNGTEADYIGMAEKYKKMLIDRGDLVKKTSGKGDIPLLVEAFMAEQGKGLFTNVTKPMTTIMDLSEWVKDMGNNSITNLLVSLKGYQQGGVSGSNAGSYKVERKIGSEKQLKSLCEQLNGQNSKLLLSMDYSLAYSNQTRKADYVYNIDHGPAMLFEKRLLYSDKYFININAVARMLGSLDKLPEYKKNILMQTTGYSLLSEHKVRREQTRTEVLAKMIGALEKANRDLNTLVIESPNEYAFKYADYAAGVPDMHSQYIYETDVVPFLQIVLSGYVDTFAPHLNYGTQQVEDALRLIDYNMYPSYLVTQKPSSQFEDTNVNDIYFSEYKSLKPYIVENYKLINESLSQVRGLGIIARSNVEDGISVTTYEGGTKIVVNYTDKDYSYEGSLAKAKSATVIKGEDK